MTGDGGGKSGRHAPRASRQLTEGEARLWEQLGRSLGAVNRKARPPAKTDEAAPSSGVGPERGTDAAPRTSKSGASWSSPPDARRPKHASGQPLSSLPDEDAALWEQVSRSLDKVKRKPRVPTHTDGTPTGPVPPADRPQQPGSAIVQQQAPAKAPVPPQPGMPAAKRPPPAAPSSLGRSPPADIDRRTHRQVAAGKLPIDAVLDLHGMTQAAAHSQLRGFLMSSQAKGFKMVLVITGKGGRGDRPPNRADQWGAGSPERGVLRRSVPMWLEEPDLRSVVVSYAAAGVRHGGEGALYIRLRKTRHG